MARLVHMSLSFGLVAVLLNGCGARSNIFGFFLPPVDKDSFGYQFDQAQAAFDDGRLDAALKFAEVALRLDRESEAANILYGFINLSLAGADPFHLAKSIVGKGASGAKKMSHFLEDQPTDTLSQLKDAVGITTSELLSMSTFDQEVIDLPLLIPNCVETVRQESQRMKLLENAVLAACPFVDEDVRVSEDYRQACVPTSLPRQKTNEAHFLWAFGHLTEALAFNAILTYRGERSSEEPTNLELRLARVKEKGQDNLNEFIEAVSKLQKVIDKILPVEGNCGPGTPTSQLRATLTDLMAVERAFGRLPHVPPQMLIPLKKGLEGVTQAGASASALRGGFTKKISEDLAAKIDQISSQKKLSDEEKKKLCANAAAISVGNQVVPETCKNPVP